MCKSNCACRTTGKSKIDYYEWQNKTSTSLPIPKTNSFCWMGKRVRDDNNAVGSSPLKAAKRSKLLVAECSSRKQLDGVDRKADRNDRRNGAQQESQLQNSGANELDLSQQDLDDLILDDSDNTTTKQQKHHDGVQRFPSKSAQQDEAVVNTQHYYSKMNAFLNTLHLERVQRLRSSS